MKYYNEWKEQKDKVITTLHGLVPKFPKYNNTLKDFETEKDYILSLMAFERKYPSAHKFVMKKEAELFVKKDILELGYASRVTLAEYWEEKEQYKKAIEILSLCIAELPFHHTIHPEERACTNLMWQGYIYREKLHRYGTAEKYYLTALNVIKENRYETYSLLSVICALMELYNETERVHNAKNIYTEYYRNIIQELDQTNNKMIVSTGLILLGINAKKVGCDYKAILETGLLMQISEMKQIKVVNSECGIVHLSDGTNMPVDKLREILNELEEKLGVR